MTVKLLTEHYLEFLSLKGGCTGSSEFTLVKMPHCLKSHVTAHLLVISHFHDVLKTKGAQSKHLQQNQTRTSACSYMPFYLTDKCYPDTYMPVHFGIREKCPC